MAMGEGGGWAGRLQVGFCAGWVGGADAGNVVSRESRRMSPEEGLSLQAQPLSTPQASTAN